MSKFQILVGVKIQLEKPIAFMGIKIQITQEYVFNKWVEKKFKYKNQIEIIVNIQRLKYISFCPGVKNQDFIMVQQEKALQQFELLPLPEKRNHAEPNLPFIRQSSILSSCPFRI